MSFFNLKLIKHSNLILLKNQNKNLFNQVISAQNIVSEIEKRNWEIALEKIKQQEESTLFQGLLSLTVNLKQFWTQEESRNWASEGLLKIGTIVNQNQTNLNKLADNLIKAIVKYSNANQGAMFIVNNEDPSNTFLEMIGCYPYERKNL